MVQNGTTQSRLYKKIKHLKSITEEKRKSCLRVWLCLKGTGY